ncbi:MAG: cell division protein SepF [Clostridia bacterium]|nr:cell division protein SepF [Clostridia bacterium]
MSSSFFNKVLYFMGIGDNIEEEQEEQETAAAVKPQIEPVSPLKKNNVVNLHTASASLPMKVVVIEPTNYDEVQEICNNLKSKKPIIVNFENIDKDVARRMVDFISGAVYALDGAIQKVSNGIVIVAPSNVDILGDLKNGIGKEDFDLEGIFSWLK